MAKRKMKLRVYRTGFIGDCWSWKLLGRNGTLITCGSLYLYRRTALRQAKLIADGNDRIEMVVEE